MAKVAACVCGRPRHGHWLTCDRLECRIEHTAQQARAGAVSSKKEVAALRAHYLNALLALADAYMILRETNGYEISVETMRRRIRHLLRRGQADGLPIRWHVARERCIVSVLSETEATSG